MKIAHIADIHIRGLSRHDEVREVFRAFVDDCRAQGVQHIAVEGDIWHTKSQGITPEAIQFLSWWFTELASVCHYEGKPTLHLRLGNHDCILQNSSRLDTITPIVEALKDPRIALYKQSGTYQFAPGFSWCVFGIADKEGWHTVTPAPGDVNIACYHGAVAGAVSESDWAIEDGLSLDFFRDYDFAFLGDIHRTQHLSRRGPENKPWISYPGTPVQQNYAEALEHCYLLWDIRSRDDFDVAERRLPNPRPFVSLEWKGSVESTVSAAIVPPGARCRVCSGPSQLSQSDMGVLVASLRSRGASEVTFKAERPELSTVLRAGDRSLAKADLRSPAALLRLLQEHHRDARVSDEEWAEVGQLITLYLSAAGGLDDGARNVRWSLRHLSFDNMFPYGEGNSIDFDSLRGITGVFGPNRSGKSSIVGTVMYALFNTTDRGPIENLHVVNARKQHCRSRFIIGVNDEDYLIDRQTVKHENKKGVVTAATQLNVFRMLPDGELADMCGEQRTDTEKVIKGLIGTARDFQLTSLAAQGDVERFIREGSTQRRLILARFLDIDVFESLHDAAKEDVRSLKDELRRRPPTDHAAEELRLLAQLSEHEQGLAAAEHERARLDAHAESMRDMLAAHGGFVPVTQAQLTGAAEAWKAAQLRLLAAEQELGVFESAATQHEERMARLQAVKLRHDPIQLQARLTEINELERAAASLRHSLATAQAGLERSARSLKILDSVPCGDSFPGCKFIKDAHASKSGADEQRVAVADIAVRLESSEQLLTAAAAEKIHERFKKHREAVELLSKVTTDHARDGARCEHLRAMLPGLQADVQRLQSVHDDLERAKNDAENVAVVELRARIDAARALVRASEQRKLEHATCLGHLRSDLEKNTDQRTQRQDLERRLKLHELVMSACSKRGIPRTIVAAALPMINGEIASILHGIVDFTVELDAEDDTNALDVFLNYGDSRRLLELGSGMEKFVSSIAIRVALTNVSSLPKTDTFIIDEGFGSLDDAGREAVGRLLQSLKRHFKSVIVISHVDEIKDAADSVLEITKVEKDSKVVSP